MSFDFSGIDGAMDGIEALLAGQKQPILDFQARPSLLSGNARTAAAHPVTECSPQTVETLRRLSILASAKNGVLMASRRRQYRMYGSSMAERSWVRLCSGVERAGRTVQELLGRGRRGAS